MAADNVDIFKKVIFRIPSERKVAAAITVLGLVYGLLFYLFLGMFAGNLVDVSFFGREAMLLFGILLFVLPSLLSGELFHRFLPDYPRNWGLFLAACNQLIFMVYSLILTGANNFAMAWNVLWLGAITVFLSNFLVVLLTIGQEHVNRIAVLSAFHPLAILAGFHFLLGRQMRIPIEIYMTNLGLLPLAGLLIVGTFLVTQYLMRSNVPDVSVLGLTSALLQKKQEALELGYPSEIEVQTLGIENGKELTVAVPWVHPGPLEGFGGGRLTAEIIDRLNRDGDGFFLHFPSTHKSDLGDPEDTGRIIDALKNPRDKGRASKLLEREYDGLKFYGRKLEDGKKIVFMDPRGMGKYDDFEISIFREIIDPEETVLIDLHNQEDTGVRQEVWYHTDKADFLRESLCKFLEELEEQELQDYRAGFHTSNGDTPVMALVEQVGDEETLLFGIEGNDASEELLELENEFSSQFDKAMLFTTDTHRSIHELSSEEQVEKGEMKESLAKAQEQVSDANIGFESDSANVKLLRDDYNSLIFSINILVRLIPLLLILVYLALVLWIF